MNLQLVIQAKRQNLAHLLRRQNVVACGVGFKVTAGEVTDELCVVVSVTKKVPKAQLASGDVVPRTLGAVATDVREVGVIRALQKRIDHKPFVSDISVKRIDASEIRTNGIFRVRGRTDRWRPAPGGVSIGHVDISAGTLGCLVTRDGELFILSNNHVLADCNAAQRGDPIIQPGRLDGGSLADQIGTLEDFVSLDFGTSPPFCPIATGAERVMNWLARVAGSKHRVQAFQQTLALNRVDAAIARPLSDDLVEKRILEIGVPKGVREATLGTRIRKSGRTTGLTTGEISQIDVTIQVSYGDGRVAMFDDQLMAGAMSQGGDSGSVVLDEEDFVVGLLFAGSDTTTILSPIQFVLNDLGVEIAEE